MGLIFKGFDTRLKRSVAIKVVSDRVKDEDVRKNIRERFFNEARAAGALSHPNLVQIYDVGEINDIVYIVMEYIEGETLEHLLKSKGPLNMDQLLRITKEIASGLSFAHKRGIVHRDIKPSNIILEASTGTAKILDFGIAKFIDEEELKLTSTGMVLGSTHYLSPEHITGRNLDGRSDIFCLGTLLYESSTGVLPFRGTNSSTILYKIVHFDPPPPNELRKDLIPAYSSLIVKCLQKKPADRYQKLEEVVESIQSIERSLHSISSEHAAASGESPSFGHTYFVRDSQLLNALVSQKKLTPHQASHLKGKPFYDLLIKDGTLTEDDLANAISDCLSLPWIPRGRLKSLKITDDAFQLLDPETMLRNSVLPFFKDEQKKILSLVIDGTVDIQKDPQIGELTRTYQVNVYIGGRYIIQRLIQIKSKRVEQAGDGLSLFTETDEINNDEKVTERRVLLIEPLQHYQQALVNLFKGYENSLTIVSDSLEAHQKVRTEKFHHIWANRRVIGDELEFESLVIRTNPSCDLRYYENLGEELFEDSIHYLKYRDFFARILQVFLSQSSLDHREQAQSFGSLGVKVARAITQNQKELDEVYFSCLFHKWEKLTGGTKRLADIFFGVYRFKHIFNCLPERFDGRGPMGIKANHIPVASRVLACLSIFDQVNPNWKKWDDESLQKLKTLYDGYSGKQLDPILTAQVLDLIRPAQDTQARLKAIVVDPDAEYANQLQGHLKRIGVDAKIFPDGISAFSDIKKNKPDLIITEVIIPKLDGFSLAARLHSDENLKEVPLIFVSRSNAPEHSVKALQLGALDFIGKDSEPQFLLAKIERLIRKH